jgi:uncharacterized membrane protein YgcG
MSRTQRKSALRIAALAILSLTLGGAASASLLSQALSPAQAAQTPRAAQPGPLRTPPVHADVNDFTVESFDAVYELGKDDEGRSTLRTTERIVVLFPDFDQNRGIIRDIPRIYGDDRGEHETDLRIDSVTDDSGSPRPFTTEEYGDFLSVTIAVPEGSFVHGAQTYVIEYSQRDVTRHFSDGGPDTGADEFYWDVNGTDWAQPFGRVSARLILDEDLVPAFNGNAACYRGAFGSGEPCEIGAEGDSIVVEEHDLAPYENITIAAGFAPGTFAGPPVPFLERVPLLFYGGLASLAAAIGLTVVTAVRGLRGAKTGRAIIAQYEPPAGIAAAVAAELVRARRTAMTATLLDLAVRRRIRLLHDEPSDMYGAQPLDETGLLPIEQSVWSRLFGGSRNSTVWFDGKSTGLGDAAAALGGLARAEVTKAGLVRKAPGGAIGVIALLFIAALGLLVLHAVVIGDFVLMTVLLAVGINVLVWLLIGLSAALLMLRPRTHAGALLHDHLMGLREYIRLAEADRIRMLQSASGAEVTEDRIVQIYERLLPYAVVFGFEREWQAELAKLYRESAPDWVGGSSASSSTFSFSRALPLAGLGSAVASSPVTRSSSSGSGSGSSFSSSFGGSGGGGFSGGGGGGGGGRGV